VKSKEFQIGVLQNEERFQLEFEDAPVPYPEVDSRFGGVGRISSVNHAECDHVGASKSDLIGGTDVGTLFRWRARRMPPLDTRNLSGAGILENLSGGCGTRNGTAHHRSRSLRNFILTPPGRITEFAGILSILTECERPSRPCSLPNRGYSEAFEMSSKAVYQSNSDGSVLTSTGSGAPFFF